MKKIVLTGGPCAGKTTALARIEQDLTELGYKVLIVSESATELIQSGARPFGDNPIDIVEFQKIIMLYQYQKEEIYNKIADTYDKEKVVIIYDRGLMDNKSYITQKQFNEVLKTLARTLGKKVTEEDILDRYDMVIHLVTAADGAEEYYTKENNKTRTEGIEEAIKLDRKTMNSWINHPNLKIIDNEQEFRSKVNKVLEGIHKLLNSPIKTRKQLKYQVEVEENILNQIKENSIITDIEQIYLKNNEYEERIRKTTQNGIVNYYYTKQKKKEEGESEIILNKKISKEEYLLISNMCEISDIIQKRRYTFIYNKQYYRLDEYKDSYILEIEVTDEKQKINIPTCFAIKKELIKRRKKLPV